MDPRPFSPHRSNTWRDTGSRGTQEAEGHKKETDRRSGKTEEAAESDRKQMEIRNGGTQERAGTKEAADCMSGL